MEALQPGQIRVHLIGGTSYDCPEQNKTNVVKSLGGSVQRIEHYKPIQVAPLIPPTAAPVVAQAAPKSKSKESLLGDLIKDGKVKAGDVIAFIDKSTSLEDLGIVMKGEGRTTVKNAYKNRITELI